MERTQRRDPASGSQRAGASAPADAEHTPAHAMGGPPLSVQQLHTAGGNQAVVQLERGAADPSAREGEPAPDEEPAALETEHEEGELIIKGHRYIGGEADFDPKSRRMVRFVVDAEEVVIEGLAYPHYMKTAFTFDVIVQKAGGGRPDFDPRSQISFQVSSKHVSSIQGELIGRDRVEANRELLTTYAQETAWPEAKEKFQAEVDAMMATYYPDRGAGAGGDASGRESGRGGDDAPERGGGR